MWFKWHVLRIQQRKKNNSHFNRIAYRASIHFHWLTICGMRKITPSPPNNNQTKRIVYISWSRAPFLLFFLLSYRSKWKIPGHFSLDSCAKYFVRWCNHIESVGRYFIGFIGRKTKSLPINTIQLNGKMDKIKNKSQHSSIRSLCIHSHGKQWSNRIEAVTLFIAKIKNDIN